MSLFIISDKNEFPSPDLAREDGLLAMGGNLSQKRLLLAYSMGIFPWFSEGEPVLWWSPDPRLVLYPEELNVSSSLKKTIKKSIFRITMDKAFEQVINECAQIRIQNHEPTWIMNDMITAYTNLHKSGFAHSVEAWHDEELAGGLYGVSLGRCFFGESMFTRVSNASKVAFAALVEYLKEHSFDIIDCQVTTEHLKSMGAKEIPRKLFLQQLKTSLQKPTRQGKWDFSW